LLGGIGMARREGRTSVVSWATKSGSNVFASGSSSSTSSLASAAVAGVLPASSSSAGETRPVAGGDDVAVESCGVDVDEAMAGWLLSRDVAGDWRLGAKRGVCWG
jgi:hypothetical protein